MRIQTTVTGLTDEQWKLLNERLLTEYEFTSPDARVCAVFEHQSEERHAEMPIGAFIVLIRVMIINLGITKMGNLMSQVADSLSGAFKDRR